MPVSFLISPSHAVTIILLFTQMYMTHSVPHCTLLTHAFYVTHFYDLLLYV